MNWITAKTVSAIIAAAITAVTGTYLVQQREANRLRHENENLAAANQTLNGERDAALSASVAINDELERLRKERNELLRLRGEVGLLRKQGMEMAGLKAENIRLRALPSSQPNSQPIQNSTATQTKFPKEAWAFAGYATPEAAMHTWIWAMNKGDKMMMLNSLVPEEQTQWQKMLESEKMKESPFNAYSFVASETISAEAATVTVVSDFPDGKKTGEQKMSLKKIGNDWKIAGQARE